MQIHRFFWWSKRILFRIILNLFSPQTSMIEGTVRRYGDHLQQVSSSSCPTEGTATGGLLSGSFSRTFGRRAVWVRVTPVPVGCCIGLHQPTAWVGADGDEGKGEVRVRAEKLVKISPFSGSTAAGSYSIETLELHSHSVNPRS